MNDSSYFVMFPSKYLDVLSARKCILMGVLIGLSKREGYAYPSNQTLSKIMNVSVDSIQRDLQSLEELNYIKREVERNHKKEIISRKIYIVDLTADFRLPLTADLRLPSPHECGNNKDNFDINKYNIDLQPEWIETLNEWLKYKKQKKKNYTEIGLSKLVSKIKTDYISLKHFQDSVDNCIAQNYDGLFPLKQLHLQQSTNIPQTKKPNYYNPKDYE